MELLYVDYQGKNRQQIILLYLGEHAGKLVGLKSDMVTPRDAVAIRSAANLLDGLSLQRRITWIQEHCPTSYKAGYRSLAAGSAQILNRFPLNQ